MSLIVALTKAASELAAQRVSEFQPEIDGAFQCARYWIESGRRSRIVSVPSSPSTYHCFACDYKIASDAGCDL
jgi:hypothetical protein